jgi:hypothetical protein
MGAGWGKLADNEVLRFGCWKVLLVPEMGQNRARPRVVEDRRRRWLKQREGKHGGSSYSWWRRTVGKKTSMHVMMVGHNPTLVNVYVCLLAEP